MNKFKQSVQKALEINKPKIEAHIAKKKAHYLAVYDICERVEKATGMDSNDVKEMFIYKVKLEIDDRFTVHAEVIGFEAIEKENRPYLIGTINEGETFINEANIEDFFTALDRFMKGLEPKKYTSLLPEIPTAEVVDDTEEHKDE